MIGKIALLLTCLVALASCQTESACGEIEFDFFNGLEQGREVNFDWTGNQFNDGASDTFDGFFYMDFTVNGTGYSFGDFYESPVAHTCTNGTTDPTSAGFATYTYNVTESLQLHRTFYAPRATNWIRVVDSFINTGSESLNITVHYYGGLGSDEDTVFHNVTEYFLVSSDNGNGDPPLSINWAGRGGRITPTLDLENDFQPGSDYITYRFDNIIVPAAEFRSVMNVIGQHVSVQAARAVSLTNLGLVAELYPNISDDELLSIVNWDLCPVFFEVVDPQSVYCTTPAMVTFIGTGDAAITFNGQTVNSDARRFTLPVTNGEAQLSYARSGSRCPGGSASFNFKVTSANLTLTADTSSSWPIVSTTGGFGEYSYTWNFPSGGDFSQVFGSSATVTVVDKEMCSADLTVQVPALEGSKVSVSSRALPALFGLAALFALY